MLCVCVCLCECARGERGAIIGVVRKQTAQTARRLHPCNTTTMKGCRHNAGRKKKRRRTSSARAASLAPAAAAAVLSCSRRLARSARYSLTLAVSGRARSAGMERASMSMRLICLESGGRCGGVEELSAAATVTKHERWRWRGRWWRQHCTQHACCACSSSNARIAAGARSAAASSAAPRRAPHQQHTHHAVRLPHVRLDFRRLGSPCIC